MGDTVSATASVELQHLAMMLEFSEKLVEIYGCMIRISSVTDSNRFFLRAKSLVHLLCLLSQHSAQDKIRSQILDTLVMNIHDSKRTIPDTFRYPLTFYHTSTDTPGDLKAS